MARVEGAYNSNLAIYVSTVAIFISRGYAGSRLSEAGAASLLQMNLERERGETASDSQGSQSEPCQLTRCVIAGDSRQVLHHGVLESSRQQVGRYRCGEAPLWVWGNGWSDCTGPR